MTNNCDDDSIIHNIDTAVFTTSPSEKVINPLVLDTGWYHFTVTVPTRIDTLIYPAHYGGDCNTGYPPPGYGQIEENFEVSIDGDVPVPMPFNSINLTNQKHLLFWNAPAEHTINYYEVIMNNGIKGGNETAIGRVVYSDVYTLPDIYSFNLSQFSLNNHYFKVEAIGYFGEKIISNYIGPLNAAIAEYQYDLTTKMLYVKETSHMQLKILDMAGRYCNSENAIGNSFDLSNLANGCYLLQINDGRIFKLFVVD